jgi:hypothetical protein
MATFLSLVAVHAFIFGVILYIGIGGRVQGGGTSYRIVTRTDIEVQ